MSSDAASARMEREQELKAFEGAEAVYLEMPVVIRVRLVGVCCTPEMMSATVVPLRTPGLSEVNRESLDFSVSWSELQTTRWSWHAPNVSWHLYFGREVVRGIPRFAEEIPPQTDRVDRYVAIASEIARLTGEFPESCAVHGWGQPACERNRGERMRMTSRREVHEPPRVVAESGWRYHHLGIPSDEPRPGEEYLEELKMYVSGFEDSAYGIEWMRFEEDSPVSELVRTVPHVAFEVQDLEAALEGKQLLGEVTSPSEGVRVAMIVDNGAPIELIQFAA